MATGFQSRAAMEGSKLLQQRLNPLMSPEEVAKRRAEFDKVKQVALGQRQKAGVA